MNYSLTFWHLNSIFRGYVETDKIAEGKWADGYEGIKCGDCKLL